MEDQENNNNVRKSTVVERKETYRDIIKQLDDIEEANDLGLETIRKTAAILSKLNSLSDECAIDEKVKCPDEVFLDASALSNASGMVVKCTKALDVMVASYEPLEFARKIADLIKANEEAEQLAFLKLIDDARNIIANPIEYSFIYGAYDFTKLPEPKERKQRVREAQVQAPKKELIELKKKDDDDDENNDNVLFLFKVLDEEFKKNKEQPLKYYDLVIDSKNYCATIENMFYFSFLIRDGKASLFIDENNVPLVKPVAKRELKNFRNAKGVNTQMITSFTMDDWNRLKSGTGLTEKHRKKSGLTEKHRKK